MPEKGSRGRGIKELGKRGTTMFDKLDAIRIRFEEILRDLSEPGVTDNQKRFQKLMKDQAELSPIVEAYEAYKQAKQNEIDALTMLSEESDSEIVCMCILQMKTDGK